MNSPDLATWREEAGLGVCSDPRGEFGRDYRILALLDRLEAAEKRLAALDRASNNLLTQLDTAEAKIARVETLARELANPDVDLITPIERAARRTGGPPVSVCLATPPGSEPRPTIYVCQWVEATHGFETAPSTSYHDTEAEAEAAAEAQREDPPRSRRVRHAHTYA